jgi:Cu+-exporting ATPase
MQVSDPVCGMQIETAKASATELYQGKAYYFCSESCHSQFNREPSRYDKREEATRSAGFGGG